MGYCTPVMRLPLVEASAETRDLMSGLIKDLGLC